LSHAIAFAAFGVNVELIAGTIHFVGDGVDFARSPALFGLAIFFGFSRQVLNTLPMVHSQYHKASLSLNYCSMFFGVLSRMSCAPVELKRVMPCFCPSSCDALLGVTTYLAAGAIPLREVRAPAVVQRVVSGVSMAYCATEPIT
jgi:hypothetical protein